MSTKPDGGQAGKYADWLVATHPHDVNVLAYLTPELRETSGKTVGDPRWYCLDYQLLSDKLLTPLLDHPNLNHKAKPFIVQYAKNLKIRHKGIKMAITNEEKEMAIALYDKYSDVFDSIYDALVSAGMIDYSTSDGASDRGRASGRLAVRLDGKVFSNETVRLLFEDVLKYLVEQKHILKLPLPWGSSNQRYVITNEPEAKHPNGKDFFYPVRYEGYTMETHYARDRAMKVLADLCEELGIEFEPIEAS